MESSNREPRCSTESCSTESSPRSAVSRFRVCPACGGELIEIRAKLQCNRCHTICETCCEGGRG